MPTSLFRRFAAVALGTSILALALVLQATLWQSTTERPDLQPFAKWVFTTPPAEAATIPNSQGKSLPIRVTGKPGYTSQGIQLEDGLARLIISDAAKASEAFWPRNAMSISSIVKIDTGLEWGGIFSCMQDNGPNEKGFILGYNKTTFFFGLSTKGTNSPTGKMTYLTSQSKYNPGQWYHITATYDGKRMQLFVDGQLDCESTEQSGDIWYADSTPFVVGSYQDSDEDFPMTGTIREIQWHHRPLKVAEIEQDFASVRANLKVAQAVAPPTFLVNPYLQFGTKNSMTIMAETPTPMNCEVSYGLTVPTMVSTKPTVASTMHEVVLEKLQPNTKYFYSVKCQDEAGQVIKSQLLTFQTVCDASQAYSFSVIGDTQKNPTITGKIAKLMWERRPNFVLHMGDVVDNGPDKKEWTEELFRPCNDLFGRVCIYPCIGNHEKNHPHYYQYFSLPKPENYYTFSYGNADFWSIDTNKPIAPGTPQYDWLEKSLANSTAKWKFVYHHHPCYSSDSDDYGNTWKENSKFGDPRLKALIPLYEKNKVDIAMNGHVHFYERTWPIKDGRVDRKNGVMYLTSGGGGGSLEDFSPTSAFFKNQHRSVYHYCYFTIFEGQLECKVFDHEGRLFDSFDIKKD